jgi:hypothetical protein
MRGNAITTNIVHIQSTDWHGRRMRENGAYACRLTCQISHPMECAESLAASGIKNTQRLTDR